MQYNYYKGGSIFGGFKKKIFNTLEVSIDNPINIFLVVLIIANVICVIMGTVDSFYTRFSTFLDGFEMFSVIVFTIEYIFRVWSCTSDKRYKHPIKGRLRYASQPLLIVDLFAFLPFYLPLVAVDLRFLRILRIFRVLRVLKLERYFSALKIVAKVIKNKSAELISTFIVIFILLIIVASMMYYIEPQTFNSIPQAMWWGIVTLTTVGYGDIYPTTVVGKLVGAILALLGIGLFGLPAGILAAGFIEEIQAKKQKKTEINKKQYL